MMVFCLWSNFLHRNAEANFKSTKHHTQLLPIKSTDCQLEQPIHVRNPSGASNPIITGDLHRQSPLDDDTDPDVIPNQYGKLEKFEFYIILCYLTNR